MKKYFKFMFNVMLTLVSVLVGAHSGVMMAAASSLPDAGKTTGGDGGDVATLNGNGEAVGNLSTPSGFRGPDGIATETAGRAAEADLYTKDIDQRITKIRPMATPVDQISRYAKAQPSDSFEVKYYSVGTRPIKCTTTAATNSGNPQSSGASLKLTISDPNMFTLDDTIRVVGVKGYKADGATQDDKELVLCVCGRDATDSMPVVYAVNGLTDGTQNIWVPAIPSGTTLVRMGKAAGELDVQTGRFNNIPTAEIQYCQNFMLQVEQSTFDKIAAKEVDWNFSDIEEDGIYDMRLAQENTYLFGVKGKVNHVTKDGMTTWFTGGIWYMAGKDIEIGEWDFDKEMAVISDENLVDISKDLFVGTGVGNKRKILFCGSNMLSAFSKIKSDKFRLKETVEVWNLRFKSWETDFGEILTIHHELFDANGMSDYGFALDPEYLTKKTHVSWTRNILDLKKAGVRNTDAVVLQEVACLYLRYAKAHARMRLAQKPQVATPVFNPEPSTTLTAGVTVTMSSATSGADIYYTKTTDGSTPADPTSASTKYTSGDSILGSTGTVKYKMIAIKDGYIDSEIVSGTYTRAS